MAFRSRGVGGRKIGFREVVSWALSGTTGIAALIWLAVVFKFETFTNPLPDSLATVNPALVFTLGLLFVNFRLTGKTFVGMGLKIPLHGLTVFGVLFSLFSISVLVAAKVAPQLVHNLYLPAGQWLTLASLFLLGSAMCRAAARSSFPSQPAYPQHHEPIYPSGGRL